MTFKKLPRVPMRREDEPGFELEIWQPSWKCFCCQDTGIVSQHLASLVIEGYCHGVDRLPRCLAPGCEAGSHYDSNALAPSVDYRIDAATCQQLDLTERDVWRKDTQARSRKAREKTIELARQKSLRKRDRTCREEQLALDRHRLVAEEDWGLVAHASAEWEGEGSNE